MAITLTTMAVAARRRHAPKPIRPPRRDVSGVMRAACGVTQQEFILNIECSPFVNDANGAKRLAAFVRTRIARYFVDEALADLCGKRALQSWGF
jgi:hypothetical protein